MIRQFLSKNPRNRLLLCATKLPEFNYIDVGKELSAVISNCNSLNRAISAYDMLMKIVEEGICIHSLYGQYIALENIGIILEPQLELNVRHIFDSLSRNHILLIQLKGEIDNSRVYFLTKTKGEKVDISGLSHLKLEKY